MPVLSRSSLEDSPLADLHVLAAELSIEGFRKLRKADLVDAILDRQPEGGGEPPEADEGPKKRTRRGGRSRSRARDADTDDVDLVDADAADTAGAEADALETEKPDDDAGVIDADDARPRRRGGRSRSRDADTRDEDEQPRAVGGRSRRDDDEPRGGSRRGGREEDDARGGSRRGGRDEDDARGGSRRGGRDEDDARGGSRRGGREEDDARGGSRRGGREEDDARGGSRRGGRDEDDARGGSRRGGRDEDDARGGSRRGGRDDDEGGETVTGVVELLGNGSGFLRVSPPEPSDDDVYISAAQIRRCELVSGDRIAGPVRAPRRSERYPSLVRIDTINDRPADEVAEGTPWDELACAFPTQRLALDDQDPTLKAIEWLTPIGRGSRVTITGGPRAGKTEALRRLAAALAKQDDLEVALLLTGVRPEEVALAPEGVAPVASLTLTASPDAQAQAVERAVDTGKRVAARGGHAVLLIDSLAAVPESVARRALGAARAIVDGGSLTIIATAPAELGGETTVIALDVGLTATNRLPALDLVASGTLHPELLVGAAGADAIAQARAAAIDA